MTGERDLARLLHGLKPRLHPDRYTFAATTDPALRENLFALVREDEGLTSIHPDPDGEWARISLDVHSSLDAVGLTAVLSSRLAENQIGANIVAARFHDHLFVPWDRREKALAVLRDLETGGSTSC